MSEKADLTYLYLVFCALMGYIPYKKEDDNAV